MGSMAGQKDHTARLEQWMDWRSAQDQHLYQQYGKALEKAHQGEFAAIDADGQTIIGTDDNEVFQKAVDSFGSGNFGFFRIGYSALEKWLAAKN